MKRVLDLTPIADQVEHLSLRLTTENSAGVILCLDTPKGTVKLVSVVLNSEGKVLIGSWDERTKIADEYIQKASDGRVYDMWRGDKQ